MFFIVLSSLFACHTSPAVSKTEPPLDKGLDPAFQAIQLPPLAPTVTALYAAEGQDKAERVIKREDLFVSPSLPPVTGDILGQLGIKLVNEFPDSAGITDDMIRSAADVSYDRLGIADHAMAGWTLSVRLSHNRVNDTSFVDKKKLVVVNLDPSLFNYAAPHELTHVLAGQAMGDKWLPGIMGEFLATAAEINQAPGSEAPFTYDGLNRPILRTAKFVSGSSDQISAYGAPLDALRYELLRAAGRKIGDVKYRELAKAMWGTAMDKQGPTTMEDFQQDFAAVGLGDCVLFQHDAEPGVYVDLLVNTNHVPMVLTKYLDGSGQETMLQQVPLKLTWKKGGEVMYQYQGLAQPVLTDDASVAFGGSMDEYEVMVGTLTYTYHIGNNSPTTTSQH